MVLHSRDAYAEIPADWRDAEFTDIPEDTAAKAKLERLGYKSLDEKLGRRFIRLWQCSNS